MRKVTVLAVSVVLFAAAGVWGAESRTDVFKTEQGNLELKVLGHGSLMFKYQGKIIHVDPFSKMADYAKLPKADILLITHDHPDHLDLKAIKGIRTEKTVVVTPESAKNKLRANVVLRNGESKTVEGVPIQAVPAYNIVQKRPSGQPYHPKGWGNGYVITFGNLKVYVAGDTEYIPEMKSLKGIDIAFLPINQPYTMTAAMVIDAARSFKPRILYPYHHAMGSTDISKLPGLMKDVPGVELRIVGKSGGS